MERTTVSVCKTVSPKQVASYRDRLNGWGYERVESFKRGDARCRTEAETVYTSFLDPRRIKLNYCGRMFGFRGDWRVTVEIDCPTDRENVLQFTEFCAGMIDTLDGKL